MGMTKTSEKAKRVVEALRERPELLEAVRDILNEPAAPVPFIELKPVPGLEPRTLTPSPFPGQMTDEEWDKECDRQGMGKSICTSCGLRWCGSGSCL